MDITKEILDIQTRLDSYWISDFNLILVMIMMLGLVVVVSVRQGKALKRKLLLFSIGITMIAVGVLGLGVTLPMSLSYEKKLAKLEGEYMDSLKKNMVEIQTSEIVHTFVLARYNCPHIDSWKDNDKCVFVKILTDDGVKHLFLAKNMDQPFTYGDSISIQTVQLSQKDREFLNEYLSIDKGGSYKALDINKEKWSFGYSINE